MTLDNLTEDQVNILLNTPHQIYLVNDILKVDITAFKSEVTFGNISPGGLPQTAVSITLATSDLYNIAKKIINAIENKKPELIQQQEKFFSEIPD